MRQAITNAPAGTWGLIVAPWSPSEPYGVAADWGQASAPVYILDDDEWTPNGRQVADFRHDPADALRTELEAAIRASGDEPDDDEVSGWIDGAKEF